MQRLLVIAGVWMLAACHGGSPKQADASVGDIGMIDSLDAHSDSGTDANGLPANAPPTGQCTSDGWCWVYPLPQGYTLHGIWGTSASDVWAFGDYGTILRFNGTTWNQYSSPIACGSVDGEVIAWGTSASDIWVVGGCGGMHWDGSAWSGSTNGTAIGGLAANDVWTGSVGTTSHWDGTEWREYAGPSGSWRALAFGGSGGTMLTVSDAGGIAQWLGTAWGTIDAGSHPANAGVVIDANHIVLAQNGAVSFWDNGTWTTRTTPVAAYWTSISAASSSDLWISGNLAGVNYFYHWDGISWSSAGSSTENGRPAALWRDSTGALWVAMWSSQVRVWNGNAWTSQTVGDNYVGAVWGTGWDDIWAITSWWTPAPRNRALHWNGTTWTDVAFPFNNTYLLQEIWGSAPNDYWIAGGHALNTNTVERVLFHWNGSAWSVFGPFGTEDYNVARGFEHIWGAAANDIYAVAQNAVYHFDGNNWTVVSALSGGTDVFGSSASDVYVINGATLWKWNGSSWTSKTMPSTERTGWANSPSDVWLTAGTTGLHYDGTFFVQNSAAGEPLIGTGAEMFTGAGERTMTRWSGGFGGTPHSEQSLLPSPRSLWRTSDGHVFAAGRGLVVR